MSSRILRGTEAGNAQSMVWAASATGPASARPQREAAPLDTHELARLRQRVAELETLVEQRTREARSQGLQEGRVAGQKEAAAEVQAALERLGRAVKDIAELRPRLRAQAETDLVRLAVAIARRVLNRELSIDPQAIAALVEAALQKHKSQEACRVRVHPEHKTALEARLAATGAAARIEVVADGGLQRGDAIIETSRGDLDASAGTQLAEIERGLADRLR